MKNVILFPSIKTENLIQEAHDAFSSKQYEAAIDLYENLLLLDITSYDVHLNYLLCLKHTQQFTEAVEYAADFIEHYTGERRFSMMELALSILFESEKYTAVTMFINDMLKVDLTEGERTKLLTVLSLANEQNEAYSNTLLFELSEAIEQADHVTSWHVMQDLRLLYVQPPQDFLSYLIDPAIHPVLKTMMLEAFILNEYTDAITIEKFGKQITVKPNALIPYDKESYVVEMLRGIEHLEQHNPSLYELIKGMILQYSYVMYPFKQAINDVALLVEAFILVGKSHLSERIEMEDVDENIATHIYNIEMCLKLYATIAFQEF